MKLEDMVSDLEDAAKLDHTEVGEYWTWLVAGELVNFQSDSMKKAWEKEVESQHRILKEEYKIVEEEKQITQKRKVLKYIGV